MNADTRMAVSAHLLALLSFANEEKQYPSEIMARSVNTNPVVVRRLIGVLKKAGLVAVGRGRSGTFLARPAAEITLLDVYRAIVPGDKRAPFPLHKEPSMRCFVGKNIHDALEMPLAKVRRAMEDGLAATTIADVAAFIRAREETEQAVEEAS